MRLAALIALVVLLAAAPARAQDLSSWHGDLASARAFLVDAAKLYELKRKTKVTVKALGTMSALEAVSKGQVDLVGSARPADPRTALEGKLAFTPVAWDSLVLLTHPSNPVKNLTLPQLKAIYAGRIKNWSELGGPAKPINLYAVAGPNDGVEFSLRRLLFGSGSIMVAAGRWYINTKQLEDAIAIDPAGMGVSTLSNVYANKGVKALSIDGVAPSLAALEDGLYTLAMPIFLVARAEAPGQTSTLSTARKALEFMRTEPALRGAWRAKQLLPASDAAKLEALQPAREQQLATLLGFRFADAPAPIPPTPPAPPKGKLTNPVRHDVAVARLAQPAKRVYAQIASADTNTVRPERAAAKMGLCRPTPVC